MHKLIKICIFIDAFIVNVAFAQSGFVKLPNHADVQSAYVACNLTGEFGISISNPPTEYENNTCAMIMEDLDKSPLNPPISGFKLIGMLVRDVIMPAPYAGKYNAVAVMSEAFWRNKENNECIIGTQLEMKESPLFNGNYWEINDISRAGFSGKNVDISYFYKPHSDDLGGNTEVLYRAGRTYTSIISSARSLELPSTQNSPDKTQPFSKINAAAYSDNWVTFSTDISYKDTDQSTRALSSIFYIKYNCDYRDPIQKNNAIKLRSLGQDGSEVIEISVPGLVPIDGDDNEY